MVDVVPTIEPSEEYHARTATHHALHVLMVEVQFLVRVEVLADVLRDVGVGTCQVVHQLCGVLINFAEFGYELLSVVLFSFFVDVLHQFLLLFTTLWGTMPLAIFAHDEGMLHVFIGEEAAITQTVVLAKKAFIDATNYLSCTAPLASKLHRFSLQLSFVPTAFVFCFFRSQSL